jgi:hypothetical protein
MVGNTPTCDCSFMYQRAHFTNRYLKMTLRGAATLIKLVNRRLLIDLVSFYRFISTNSHSLWRLMVWSSPHRFIDLSDCPVTRNVYWWCHNTLSTQMGTYEVHKSGRDTAIQTFRIYYYRINPQCDKSNFCRWHYDISTLRRLFGIDCGTISGTLIAIVNISCCWINRQLSIITRSPSRPK